MATTLYAHLPGLKLAESEVQLGGGRLTRLPFCEWASLESEFRWAERDYEKSQPVFWIRELPTDSGDAIETVVGAALWPLHTAFLLDHHTPLLPTPLLSSCYICWDTRGEYADVIGPSVKQLIGPVERELIVYGNALSYTYSAAELGAVERRLQFIETNKVQDLDDEIGAGIHVLEETARPDSWYGGDQLVCQLHGFVRCMAACESILLPGIDEGEKSDITQTFGRNAAMLFAASAEQRMRAEKYFVELYRLRTQLIHGRASPLRTDAETGARLAEGRRLLRYLIMAALLLRTRTPEALPLRQVLQESWKDPERQARLAQILTDLTDL